MVQSTFDMDSNNDHLKAISDIRNMMERSSRFISLSGLSGVIAGVFALLGALAAYIYLENDFFSSAYFKKGIINGILNLNFMTFFFVDAMTVLALSLTFGIFFTTRNAKRKGLPLLDKTSKRMIVNLLIPLMAGGIFCIILVYHHIIYLVAPATLLFYGLALLNASKYTLKDIRYLGITEIILGLISCFFIGYGLIFWALGFGVLHIIYGISMYLKYERNHESEEQAK